MPRRTRRSVLRWVMSSPRKRMLPRQAGTRPMRTLRRVVLPAPLAPSRTTLSPSWTATSTPHSTWTRPYPASMPAAASRSPAMCRSQEDFDDAGVAGRRREWSLEDRPPGVEHHHTVRHPVDEAHEVLDHEKRNARGGQGPEFLRHAVELRRREARRQLVDAEQPRRGGEGSGEVQHLLLDAGELASPPSRHGVQLQGGEEGPDVGGGDLHVLLHRETGEGARDLEGPVDAQVDQAVRGDPSDGPAAEVHVAPVGPVEPRDDVDAGGLAGPVGAHEAQDLSRPEVEADAVEGAKPPEALHERLDPEEDRPRLRGHRSLRASARRRGRWGGRGRQ